MQDQMTLFPLEQPTSVMIRVRPAVRPALLAVDVWLTPDGAMIDPDDMGNMTGTWVYPSDLADHLCHIGAVVAGLQFVDRSRRP